jgi:hypothetical protein
MAAELTFHLDTSPDFPDAARLAHGRRANGRPGFRPPASRAANDRRAARALAR